MADPFLHSPWIDQVLDPENPRQTFVPLIADSDSSYYVIGKEFPTPPGRKPGSAQATIPKHLEGNRCVRCHAPQRVPEFFNVKLDELKMGRPSIQWKLRPENNGSRIGMRFVNIADPWISSILSMRTGSMKTRWSN